jgi:hypothetical protein
VRRRAVSTVLLAAMSLVTGRADADDFLDGSHDLGFFRAESFVTLGALPALSLNGDDTPRRIVGAAVPATNQIWHGIGAAFAIRDNFLTWDVLSFRYSVASSALSGTSFANEQSFNVGVSGLQSLEIGVPLCGVPSGFAAFIGRDNTWKLAFAVDVGLDHMWASAEAFYPRGQIATASIDDWSPYLRASASACKKLGRWTGDAEGPTAWFCLTASPKIVDGNGTTGVSLGARIDL